MSYAALDSELSLHADGGEPCLCWQRGAGGARVSCALSDVLGVTAQGGALQIHHYPLVQAVRALQALALALAGAHCAADAPLTPFTRLAGTRVAAGARLCR
jgi:hypothetical protein